MGNTHISYKNIIEDLKNVLVGYVAPLNLTFTIGPEKIYIDDVFMKNGAMPLFLYNKQEFINQYINKLNNTNSQYDFFAQIIVNRADPSYFGTHIEIRHNLFLTMDGAEIDNGSEQHKIYNDFIIALAQSILSEPNFIFIRDQKIVKLDLFWADYDKFMKEMVLKQLQAANLNLNNEDK